MAASEFAVETARVQHPAWIEDLLHLLLQREHAGCERLER
jgi:hypothetical protein